MPECVRLLSQLFNFQSDNFLQSGASIVIFLKQQYIIIISTMYPLSIHDHGNYLDVFTFRGHYRSFRVASII